MESHLRGAAIRPPEFDPIVRIFYEVIDNIDTLYTFLKEKADQTNFNAVGLELICYEAGYILHEIHHLRRQDPSRLLRVWIHVEHYREALIDIHLAIDRTPNFPSGDIDRFRDSLRNILTDIRETPRNNISPCGSGTNSSIVQGVGSANISGGQYSINIYNVGPELIHFLEKQFRNLFFLSAIVLF